MDDKCKKAAADLIEDERKRQDEKWGSQHHSPAYWNEILSEELGESVKATMDNDGLYITEMIHAAAVAKAAVESHYQIHMDPRIYLAGPMLACSDDEANDWREYAKDHLNIETLDPCRRPFQDDTSDLGKIIKPDKKDIDRSAAILANCWKPSAGTSMEILYAWERGKHVISIVPPDQVPSAWIVYHSSAVYTKLGEGIDALNVIFREI